MKEGYWIQRSTGKTWQVTEHSDFAKSEAGAEAMGLPQHVRDAIKDIRNDYGGPERAEICINVMKAGYIRMRGHGAQYSFEFWGDTRDALWAIFEFCQQMAGPFTWVVINNLKSNEQYASSYQDLEKRMKSDEAEVLRIATKLVKNPVPPSSAGGSC